jgi:hypothetical protein
MILARLRDRGPCGRLVIDGNGDIKDNTAMPHQADFDRRRAGVVRE